VVDKFLYIINDRLAFGLTRVGIPNIHNGNEDLILTPRVWFPRACTPLNQSDNANRVLDMSVSSHDPRSIS
jgi:hypothetical protein